MDRRRFLGGTLGFLAATTLGAPLARAQSCTATRTLDNIEGPFYRAGAPARLALADEPRLVLRGTVRDTSCRPMADAVLDFWHADEHGEYDLQGYRHRGIVRTDAHGAFQLSTIRPGNYRTGGVVRPAHIHVKVRANRRPELTTQLYFSNDPHNDADPWFRESLVLSSPPHGCMPNPITITRFDFVV